MENKNDGETGEENKKSGIKRTLAKGKEMMVKTENTTLENFNYFMCILFSDV